MTKTQDKTMVGNEKFFSCECIVVCVMDGEEYDCIYSFLETGTYPSAYHKAQKRSLRRKREDIAVDSGVLYRKKEIKGKRGNGISSSS